MDVTIPEIAENVASAEVGRIMVRVGDTVEADEPLLELEADKASFELPSPAQGKVTAIHVSQGDEVHVGDKALTIEAPDEASNGAPDEQQDGAPAEEPDEEAPDEAQDEEEDDAPEERTEPAPESDAARDDDEADADEGDDGHNGDASAARARGTDGQRPPRAAPSTRKLARELGVALSEVAADAQGRISRQAVRAHAEGRRAPADDTRAGEVRKLSKLRRTAAERITRAWRSIPHVTQHELVDVTALETARRRYAAEDGPKLTLSALVARAAIGAIADHPLFNGHYDEAAAAVRVFSEVHLGVAVDTERGLLVPVIRDAGALGLRALAERIGEVAEAARSGALGLGDMRGATFTISNLGGIAGSFFTPIINPPEVAILGVGRVRADTYGPGQQLPLSLSYDHRVVDGADGARFIRAIAGRLTDPLALSL